jgi:hypothetical protein
VYHSFSPRDVVFSGWVGDQDPTFDGLQNALMNIFHSAWRNYVNFGSDIGSSSSSAYVSLVVLLICCVRACTRARRRVPVARAASLWQDQGAVPEVRAPLKLVHALALLRD